MDWFFDSSDGDTFADSENGNIVELELRAPGHPAAEPAGWARMPYDAADEVQCTCPFCAVHSRVPMATSRAA